MEKEQRESFTNFTVSYNWYLFMISILQGIQWVEIQPKKQIQATFDFYRIQHMAAFTAKVLQADI